MPGLIIGHLKSTLDCLKPLVEDIAQHNNKALDCPQKELETFRMQMKNGVELVRKCSKFNEWTSNETYKYTSQLFELDEYLQRQLSVLMLQVASDVKETSVMLKNVRKVVERIEGISGVAKNQQLALNVVEVDETRDVRETTLVSASNVEAELTLVDGEDDEIPGPPSFTVGLEDPLEELMRMSGQKPRKKENSKMKLLKDGVAMLDPTGPYKRMRARAMARERNPIMLGALREFSYRDLKEATNNFDFKHIISRGECVVYRGLLSKDNLEVAVKKYSRAESEGKDDLLAQVTNINLLHHKHIVRLPGELLVIITAIILSDCSVSYYSFLVMLNEF
ncbi:uncharacterized protein LOC133707109 [Rosa rugosa]|uniref:uncharacterized protein LOC133707109 n=1 Tax=Rosa rugosa TaxID=74645 RepID=UPI002B4046A2|nr:uncharacterized protein LOC133707109 [Rosa rugosa]XP_061988632.1 uncharacterized protein LOC133707109 [Rosa rugosa]